MEYPSHQRKFIVVIPVYNEEEKIGDLLAKNLRNPYENVVFWVINDCSTDRTKKILDRFEVSERLKITHLEENLGKAGVLNYALKNLDNDYFVCADSDTLMYPNAFHVLNNVIFNEQDETVAAYTGTLTVEQGENNDILLKIQKLEYRSIIAMIKRTQDSFLHNLMTISGALVCYKTSAIKQVGGFNEKNVTEDIEISWRFSSFNLRSRFIEELCGEIYSPRTNYSLVKQRVRWSLGGIQTIRAYLPILKERGMTANKFFIFESFLSSLWIFNFIITTMYLLSKFLFGFPSGLEINDVVLPTVILLVSSMILQIIAYRQDKGCREFFDEFLTNILVYPLLYWFIQPIGYFGGLWKYYRYGNNNDAKWRKVKKRNLRLMRIISLLLDLIIYFLIIYFWRLLIIESINFLPKTTIALYNLFTFFWMGVGIIYLYYFIFRKKPSFGESIVGIKLYRKRSLIQNIFRPITIFIFINLVINLTSISTLVFIGNYEEIVQAITTSINSRGVINSNLYLFLIILFVEKYFGYYDTFVNNRLLLE